MSGSLRGHFIFFQKKKKKQVEFHSLERKNEREKKNHLQFIEILLVKIPFIEKINYKGFSTKKDPSQCS
jgi:hypothetical protein